MKKGIVILAAVILSLTATAREANLINNSSFVHGMK